jgi:hypothetical protein
MIQNSVLDHYINIQLDMVLQTSVPKEKEKFLYESYSSLRWFFSNSNARLFFPCYVRTKLSNKHNTQGQTRKG